MRRRIEFTRVIRGTEVIVFADEFDGDPSVGLEFGPNCVWANTFDDKPFELTDEEAEQLGIEATKFYAEDDGSD